MWSVTPASISNLLAAETNTEEAHSIDPNLEAFSEGNRNWLAHLKHLMGNSCNQMSAERASSRPDRRGRSLGPPSSWPWPPHCSHFKWICVVCVCTCVCVISKEKIKCKHTFNKLSPLTPLPEGTIWCSFGHSRCPYGLPSRHELMWE